MACLVSLGGGHTLNVSGGERPALEGSGRVQVLERIKEKLDLSDDQVSQIKAEFGAKRARLKSLLSRLHEARVELRAAIRAANASEDSVRAVSAKLSAVQADLAVERFKLYGAISPVLTDEQREKVKEFEVQIDDWVDAAINRFGKPRQIR